MKTGEIDVPDRLGHSNEGLNWRWNWDSGKGCRVASASRYLNHQLGKLELYAVRLETLGKITKTVNYEGRVCIKGTHLLISWPFPSRILAQRWTELQIPILGNALSRVCWRN